MLINEAQSLKHHEIKACVLTVKEVFAGVGRIEEDSERSGFLEILLSSNFLHGHLGSALVLQRRAMASVADLCSISVIKGHQSPAPLATQWLLPFPSSEVSPFYLFLLISYFRKDAHLLITTL